MICPNCDGSGVTSPSDVVDAETCCYLCDGSGEAPSMLPCGHPTVVWRGTGFVLRWASVMLRWSGTIMTSLARSR
jgi:DnaJ-class molecular chaperone